MSDEDGEDDYLSDKFLTAGTAASTPTSTGTKTYSDLRRAAHRRAEEKNLVNRTKSRAEREREAREQGLSRSLIERAEAEAAPGGGDGANKALAMMKKMGFKPGQALGQANETIDEDKILKTTSDEEEVAKSTSTSKQDKPTGHLINPLPFNEWTGKVTSLLTWYLLVTWVRKAGHRSRNEKICILGRCA
jgi:hypothetical protein